MVRLRVLLLLAVGVAAQDYEKEWNNFKEAFGKSYNGIDEEGKRFAIFKENLDIISKRNGENLSYKLGVNFFADLTADEVAASYTGLKPSSMWAEMPHLGTAQYSGKALADSVDWTTKGAVTPVKNQGQCGSCWSFSTTGALEGALEIATGKLVSLSEQQFVDCDKVDQGCSGGLMDNAFQYAEKNAICTEESYSYKGRRGTCEASSCSVGIPKGSVAGYKDVAKDDMQALMEAVSQQPVSIAIEADKSAFQLYRSGILSSTCGTKLDHGVLLVGYGSDNGKDYWKVKNSWGTTYGEDGYIRLERGKGGAGECGLLSGPPSFPVVSGSGPSPGPSPPPSPPSPPTPGSSHYEKPPCRSDEVAIQVQGISGSTCTPKCSGTTCPTDVPAGTTAKPQCVLQDSSSGDKYCALTCLFGGCPSGAKCEHIGLTGICMYQDSKEILSKKLEVAYDKEWKDFKEEYGKSYNGIDEEARRFQIFKDNLEVIQKTNDENLSYKLRVNFFADLTGDEVEASYTGFKPSNMWAELPHLGTVRYSGKTLAESVDWTAKGAVTPVKNQGQCGSCWSFSTTGALEGAWEIATGKLVSLSEQQFVDCDKVDQGCSGGLMDNAFRYAEKNALCTERSYSYKARRGTCEASSCTVGIPQGSVTGYKDVAKDDMQALMEAVTQQPVSIAIEADKSAFQFYHSGVLSSHCGTRLDHGVLLVGYGTDNGKDYWKVKNSWGTNYGENGFIRLERGKGGAGECGLLSGPPSFPVVQSQDFITV